MNKKAQELAMHEKDTGSSEVQIALLTEKIETLSTHIKQFKKDKHSSVGLLRAVNDSGAERVTDNLQLVPRMRIERCSELTLDFPLQKSRRR